MSYRTSPVSNPDLESKRPLVIVGLALGGLLLYRQMSAPATPSAGGKAPPPPKPPADAPSLPPGTDGSTGKPAQPGADPLMVVGSKERRDAIGQAYLTILCREGEAVGRDGYDKTGLSIAAIRADIQHQPEGLACAMVRQLYTQLLGRDPLFGSPADCRGLRSFVDRNVTADQVRAEIMAGPEYLAKHPASPVGGGAPSPPAAPPALPPVNVGVALTLAGASRVGDAWQVTPGRGYGGMFTITNPNAQNVLAGWTLQWKSADDATLLLKSDVLRIPANTTVQQQFVLLGPTHPGTYHAYLGLTQDGVTVVDSSQPEGGGWDISVVTPAVATGAVGPNGEPLVAGLTRSDGAVSAARDGGGFWWTYPNGNNSPGNTWAGGPVWWDGPPDTGIAG